MRLMSLIALTAALILAPQARADEIGGSGFSVPQSEWLWGVEGLVRTPVDLGVNIGASFRDYEMDVRTVRDSGADAASNDTTYDPEGIEGGFRLAGGIGYWSCCVLIEPALGFRFNGPMGDERSDDAPSFFGFGSPIGADVEINEGWELVFGPQMTYMIKDSTPLLGSHLGLTDLPLVFFPVVGVTHIEWDIEYRVSSGFRRSGDFEDDAFTVGYDLDFPLPGSHWDFTHALTFMFRWIEGNGDEHDFGPVAGDSFNIHGLEGWRIGLFYNVTWNDFEGFVKRNIFGPID